MFLTIDVDELMVIDVLSDLYPYASGLNSLDILLPWIQKTCTLTTGPMVLCLECLAVNSRSKMKRTELSAHSWF